MSRYTEITPQDVEDYEQEKRIRNFLQDNGIPTSSFDFKYQSNKRNYKGKSSNIRGAFSLDETIGGLDGGGKFSDIITSESDRSAEARLISRDEKVIDAGEVISTTLEALGIKGKLKTWTVRVLKRVKRS